MSLNTQHMSRRTFTGGLAGTIAAALGGGALLSLPPASALAAQTPAAGADLTSLGLPTLDITVTQQAFEGLPETIEPGRYLLTVTAGDGVETAGVGFASPGPNSTIDDLLMIMGGGGGATPDAGGASPEPGASPAAGGGEEQGAPPSFVYQAHFAGGITGLPDHPGHIVIDLGPGDWIMWGDDPAAPQPPVTFTISGEMPSDLPEPNADINVTFIDFGISVDGNLTAGDHILRLENQGAQPHFLFLAKGPDGLTNDMVSTVLAAEMSGGTPPPLPFDPDTALQPVLATGTQSIGTVTWAPVSLESGTYAAFCFFPTAGEGHPHAYHGMHTVFTVS
jgi:hypothetical protein